jgi:hypothetical protein
MGLPCAFVCNTPEGNKNSSAVCNISIIFRGRVHSAWWPLNIELTFLAWENYWPSLFWGKESASAGVINHFFCEHLIIWRCPCVRGIIGTSVVECKRWGMSGIRQMNFGSDKFANSNGTSEFHTERPYPSTLLLVNFVQLSLHNAQLPFTSAVLQTGYSYECCRQDSNSNSRVRKSSAKLVLGGLVFILGVAVAYGAYGATDQPNPSWGWRVCGVVCWGVMFVLVGYGTLLAIGF